MFVTLSRPLFHTRYPKLRWATKGTVLFIWIWRSRIFRLDLQNTTMPSVWPKKGLELFTCGQFYAFFLRFHLYKVGVKRIFTICEVWKRQEFRFLDSGRLASILKFAQQLIHHFVVNSAELYDFHSKLLPTMLNLCQLITRKLIYRVRNPHTEWS